jgi:hypothetical protein
VATPKQQADGLRRRAEARSARAAAAPTVRGSRASEIIGLQAAAR